MNHHPGHPTTNRSSRDRRPRVIHASVKNPARARICGVLELHSRRDHGQKSRAITGLHGWAHDGRSSACAVVVAGGGTASWATGATRNADVGHPPGPPFENATPPGIPGFLRGAFLKLGFGGSL